jgi:N-acetylglucosaminyl-diphospho-decaprenol L-rhamnosyltransferase
MEADFNLAVVIVNFRTGDLVVDCLKSLMVAETVPEHTRIVVVDGASGDNSVERIAEAIETHGWDERVSLLPLDVNGGFAYGNNRGIEHAIALFGKPRYVLLLNPDTVARPGAIMPLLEFMDAHPAAGIAGSRLEDPDGTRQACAFRFPSIAAEFESEIRFGPVTRLLSRWQIAPEMSDQPSPIDWVSGACMIVRMEVLEHIGRLDESYFLYYEEVDFCIRAARANWECWHVPASRVVHLVGQATGVTVRGVRPPRRPLYWFDSRRRYFSKHHGRGYKVMADAAWIVGHVLCSARQLIQGRPTNTPPRLLRDFIRFANPLR